MTREAKKAWELCRLMYDQYVSLCGCADHLNDTDWKAEILNSLDEWVNRECDRFKEESAVIILRGGQEIIRKVVNLERGNDV